MKIKTFKNDKNHKIKDIYVNYLCILRFAVTCSMLLLYDKRMYKM